MLNLWQPRIPQGLHAVRWKISAESFAHFGASQPTRAMVLLNCNEIAWLQRQLHEAGSVRVAGHKGLHGLELHHGQQAQEPPPN